MNSVSRKAKETRPPAFGMQSLMIAELWFLKFCYSNRDRNAKLWTRVVSLTRCEALEQPDFRTLDGHLVT
jgi:hypothetical protein